MYSTCMFCNRSLGANEVIETFPVGRRLAFDSEKGRLWVVCHRCERWNLTPLEERWEAIEDCERLFRGTRVRTSTDNVGLARHREGLELVRIGQPLRPEFAAWRYGDQFGRRRRRAILYGAGAIAVVGGVVVGGLATGVISAAFLGQSGNFVNMWINGRTLTRVRTPDGRFVKLKLPDLRATRLLDDGEGNWRLLLVKGRQKELFEGDEALRVAGRLMTGFNRAGGRTAVVQEAVRQIEDTGHPVEFLRLANLEEKAASVRAGRASTADLDTVTKHDGINLSKLPTPTKLAVEMALHEEHERRALQGELRALEIAWREAEEIAAIADDLLLPEGTSEFLEEHRGSQPVD